MTPEQQEARQKGEITYIGGACKNGHTDGVRYTRNGACVECQRGYDNDPNVRKRKKEYDREYNSRSNVKQLKRKHHKAYSNRTDSIFKKMINSARRRRSEGFSITEQDLKDMWKKQEGLCYYSGKPMELVCGDGKKNPNKVSIDRVDSSKGYTLDNIVLCKVRFQWAKNELSEADYIEGNNDVTQYHAIKAALETFRSCLL